MAGAAQVLRGEQGAVQGGRRRRCAAASVAAAGRHRPPQTGRSKQQARPGQAGAPDCSVLVGKARGIQQLWLIAGRRRRCKAAGGGSGGGVKGSSRWVALQPGVGCASAPHACLIKATHPPVVKVPTSQPSRASAETALSGSAAVACMPPDSADAMYSCWTRAPAGGQEGAQQRVPVGACELSGAWLAGLWAPRQERGQDAEAVRRPPHR